MAVAGVKCIRVKVMNIKKIVLSLRFFILLIGCCYIDVHFFVGLFVNGGESRVEGQSGV